MIYFDNNATTQVAPEVVAAMLPYFGEFYGNPSAGYRFARESRKAIDVARGRVAALIGAEPGEIVFTSCGTESNNSAVASALRVFPERKHLVVSAVEHSAILKLVEWRFGLPALTPRDAASNNIAHVLDFRHPDASRPRISVPLDPGPQPCGPVAAGSARSAQIDDTWAPLATSPLVVPWTVRS